MKKGWIFVALSVLLIGCARKPAETPAPETGGLKETGNVSAGVPANEDTAGSGEEEGTDTSFDTLTPEALQQLADKHGALTLEDFAPYLDLSPMKEKGSLWTMLEFSYQGEPMYLRISASDKSVAAAPYEGTLDGAVIFQKEFLTLDTAEKEYAYQGSCADIRSGKLENILNGTVKMDDYITVTLPKGFTQGDYKYWMGSHGGAAFLKEGQTQELTLENAGIYAEKPLSGGIEIWGNGELGQGTEVVKELEPLKLEDITLERMVLKTDQGTQWYAACTEQGKNCIFYCFYLNAAEFTEKEFLDISATIRVMENAVY